VQAKVTENGLVSFVQTFVRLVLTHGLQWPLYQFKYNSSRLHFFFCETQCDDRLLQFFFWYFLFSRSALLTRVFISATRPNPLRQNKAGKQSFEQFPIRLYSVSTWSG